MQIQKKSEWFVEPLDSHTNEFITKYLHERGAADNAHNAGLPDGSGKPHDVISLPSYDTVRLLLRSAQNIQFKFKIFIRLPGKTKLSRWQPIRRTKKPIQAQRGEYEQVPKEAR